MNINTAKIINIINFGLIRSLLNIQFPPVFRKHNLIFYFFSQLKYGNYLHYVREKLKKARNKKIGFIQKPKISLANLFFIS